MLMLQARTGSESVCSVEDKVEEDRQETRRPARRLSREAVAGEKGRGRHSREKSGGQDLTALGSLLGVGGRETEEPRTTWQLISSCCEGGTLLEDPLTSFSPSQHLRRGVLYTGKSSLLRTSERPAQSTF